MQLYYHLVFLFILTMHTIGSNSFSPGTSIHVISIALGSPGEQGVKRSSTNMLGSSLDGPRALIIQVTIS